MGRRAWLGTSARGCLGLLAAAAVPSRGARLAPAATTFAIVGGDDGYDAWWLGARLGAAEAESTAALVRSPLSWEELDADGVGAFLTGGGQAVVAALPPREWDELERAAVRAGALLLDARPVRPSGAPCHPTVFRLGRSERSGDDGATDLLAWHPALDRYGAEQLNQRHEARWGRGMDGAAWTAWVAVKVLSESALRTGSRDGELLARHLAGDAAVFDGHKGSPLRFRASDHQLEHPLYRIGDDGRPVEADASPLTPRGATCEP